MTYRDEEDALRAKVAELEGRLAQSEAKVAELSGASGPTTAESGEELGSLTSAGTPRSIRLTKTLGHTLTSEGYEAIAALLRARLRVEVSQVGQSLTSKGDVFSLKVEDGRTVISLRGELTDPATVGWSTAALPALFGGAIVAALAHDVGHATDAIAALNAAWAIPAIGLLVSSLVRPRAKRRAEAELAERRGTFAALVELAEKHRSGTPVKARVVLDEPTAADEPAGAAAVDPQAARE